MTTYLEEEDECRVCRDTRSESEPLISPCKCDGSIRFVHEACLVKWLEIKKSETCELCGHKFKFAAIYRDDTRKFYHVVECLIHACIITLQKIS